MLNVSELKRGDVIEHPLMECGFGSGKTKYYAILAVTAQVNGLITGNVMATNKDLGANYYKCVGLCKHWRKVE